MDWLILVPTAKELDGLDLAIGPDSGCDLCGFGPVAAAARTMQLIERHRPRRLLLTGIAGAFDLRLLEHAAGFEHVALDGIGAESTAGMLGPRELGIPMIERAGDPTPIPVFDRLELTPPAAGPVESLLLTVCVASGSEEQAAARRRQFAGVGGEDMEAFGVALSATLAGIPLTVVRGFSNLAGDRNRATWRIAPALSAAGDLVREIL